MLRLIGPIGSTTDITGAAVAITHGFRDGLTPRELFALVPGTRRALARIVEETTRRGYGVREASGPRGYTVLARAMRANRPGIVFANAAASGEIDPLTDVDSRLFVGLAVTHRT